MEHTLGAATWGNGTAGITGIVSATNSLVGTTPGTLITVAMGDKGNFQMYAGGDRVGSGVTALANGNYVVASPDWSKTKGAATWVSGTVGLTGTVSVTNSLVGTTPEPLAVSC